MLINKAIIFENQKEKASLEYQGVIQVTVLIREYDNFT